MLIGMGGTLCKYEAHKGGLYRPPLFYVYIREIIKTVLKPSYFYVIR